MKFKTEAQLQAAAVVEFSRKYPEQRGRLFMVNNRSLAAKDGVKLRSMGMFPGVSDLCYIREDKTIVGIEVKLPGKRHPKDHIINQYNWGLNASEWYVLTELDEIHAIVQSAPYAVKYRRDVVLELIKKTKTKSLIF
ncbi:MAG: hypothetical protein S4CHLAM20_04480 [Chlamydiia bacterium]|nr:hypothetical protein [Chlamydiia bacterium]